MRPLMEGNLRPIAAAALAVAWFVAAPAMNAEAQTQPPSRSAPAPSAQTPSIPEEKLDKAAAAMQKVTIVRQDYQAKIEAAPPADKERISGEANKAAVKAVTDEGLSLEEYTSIIQVAQNNPEIRQKILQRIQTKAK